MPMRKTGRLCEKHGGACDSRDANWLCDQCAIIGYKPCKCGGNVRGFGEAMFSCAGCEECDESVFGLDVDVKELWNAGVRGSVR